MERYRENIQDLDGDSTIAMARSKFLLYGMSGMLGTETTCSFQDVQFPIPISMRGPGIEPGSQRLRFLKWQRRILTTILPALNQTRQKGFIKVYFQP